MSTAQRARTPTSAPKRAKERLAWWSWALPLTMLVLAATVPFLVWYAADAIVTSTDGRLTERITDPSAPGYEVAVVPSPSHFLIGLDPSGNLDHVALLSLAADDDGGTVLVLPAETLVEPDVRLFDAYRDDGEDGVRSAVSNFLGIGIDAMTVLDEDAWATLLAPVGPISVDITEDLVRANADGTGETTVWEAGTAAVAPEEAGSFLSWVNRGEDRFNRLRRQERFWSAWMASVAASDDPGVVPGEVDAGIGRFVRGIARDPVVTSASATAVDVGDRPAFEIDRDELRDTVVAMVPFPLPPEDGDTPRVRLLDGAGGIDTAGVYGPQLTRAGAQIVILGNAPVFGAPRTAVIYHDDKFVEQAAILAEAIGATEVYLEDLEEPVIDITVIIGEDQRA